jgi:hypothetical protein
MKIQHEAEKIIHYIENLADFTWLHYNYKTYRHMGATLTDAGLQAGLNYRTVVFPRVERLLSVYPKANTTSNFLETLDMHGVNSVLAWNHPEKPRRIYDMTLLFFNENIETEQALAEWLKAKDNRMRVREIPGVGEKTVNYLRKLAGTPAIAVDRHLKTFACCAGVECKRYSDLERVFEITADVLGLDYCSLDHSIWSYVANSDVRERRQLCLGLQS